MPSDELLEPIDPSQLQQLIETSSRSELLAFTLRNRDILLGAIHQSGKWDGETVLLAFNMPEGKRYGHAQLAKVPATAISAIHKVPLSQESTPKLAEDDVEIEFFKGMGFGIDEIRKITSLAVHNYPNPLASIIYEHNMPIVEAHNFEVWGLVEKSLSQDGIPTKGIYFDKDFLMYADWDFFQTQAKGEISISAAPVPGLVQIEKSIRMSPEELVLRRLKSSLDDRIRRTVSPATGEYRLLQGVLLVPDPAQDEIMEGEVSYLYQVGISTDGSICPILIKAKHLKFPIGFLNKVSSKLTFYGEMLPIPVSIVGSNYSQVLLSRAIAHLIESN